MKRYALIISYAGEAGEDGYCDGVAKDVANYSSFLTSGVGGFWKQSEIEKLDRPSVAAVRAKMKLFSNYDYVMVIFAGHGFHSETSKSTVLDLNAKESIDSTELRKGASKQTLILDCCRKKSRSIATETRDSMMKSAAEASVINPLECRKYYDKQIEECGSGIVVLNACSIDEYANDDALKGGYYSSSLLDASNGWVRSTRIDTSETYKLLSIVSAHNQAVPSVQKKSGDRQNPVIEKPRTDKFFPFCVIA